MADSLRVFLPVLRRRLGMYVPSPSFTTVCAFIAGYRWGSDDELLVGFQSWLLARGKGRPELGWPTLVLCELYPQDRLPDPALLADEQDAAAVNVLFDLLDEYIACRTDEDDRGTR